VPDLVFEDLFTLFSRYSWSLNDTPGGDDREINPDVLGYIFEKYINQKEFGAYYTRPEITDYLCEQTIHQLVLDRVNASYAAAKKLHETDPKAFPAPRRYETIEDLLLHATGSVAQKVLQDILPQLSLLDPACGSGAFLVAALKTLLNLYTALIGRCEALTHKPVLQWIEGERKKHKESVPVAYWLKKKIVTENLHGVDLMEEATEIAKLRLFLSLVASADSRDQLEPLPNIEFNLLPGNSLIGLLHVDPTKFDSKGSVGVSPASSKKRLQQSRIKLQYEEALGFTTETTAVPTTREKQQAHVAVKQAAKYDELLRSKNILINTYKQSTERFKDLAALKRDIDALKTEARAILDQLLLDQFNALGIQFEQATWDAAKKKEGKPEKRPLKLADIEALQPFHWAYEFDQIIVNRGGFDAIITNPPWENFKPDAKEFFQKHSELVTKNAMRLEDFEKEKESILAKHPELKSGWLDYLSGFPHVNLYFRNSPQYANQTAIINGRKATTDLNLYKLFTEQCTHLLNKGARCGIVIPSGIYTDLGATQLRRMLFESTRITGLFCFENRRAIFEGVHRSFKFVVLIRAMRMRSISRMCKAAEIETDVESSEIKIDSSSYRVAFRDIARNTDERTMISTMLPPGVYCPDTIRMEVVFRDEIRDGKLHLNQTSVSNRERLAFLATLNSFALDFQVRQKVTTHVSLFLVYQLPIPRLTAKDSDFLPLVERAARLVGTTAKFDDLLAEIFGKNATHKTHGVTDPQTRLTLRAQIDALVARLYDLTIPEFQHILSTFPLVDESVKSQTLNAYRELVKLGKFAENSLRHPA
jgi:hypothetical protein